MNTDDRDRSPLHATDWALVRATHLPRLALPPWPDLTGSGPEHVGSWVGWMRELWSIPEVADALGHASPELDRQVRALCRCDNPDVRQTRRAVLSIARYLRRMTGRPTPAGLLAGIAPIAFGRPPHVLWGAEHRVVCRADAGWLAEVIRKLEGRHDVLRRLVVVANSATTRRGDRLVVPHQPSPNAGEARPQAVEVSLRHTPAVRVALDAARAPARMEDVVGEVITEFPEATSTKVMTMLAELVAHRALITGLHAPATEPDALGWLLGHLDSVGGSELETTRQLVAELRSIHRLLSRCGEAPAGKTRDLRAGVADRMRHLASTRRHPVTVDLRLDTNIVLPEQLAREAERTVSILARLSPHPHGTPAWRDFHRRFYQRYGAGALVPLLDVVADSGIGWPDGYPGSTTPALRGDPSRRDEVLLELAQAAALDGQLEVSLDEPLIARIAPDATERVRLPPHLELSVRVAATDPEALRRGDFRMTVTSISRAAGVTTGRFLGILDPVRRDQLTVDLANLPGSDPDTVCAQLSFPPLDPGTAHVGRAVQVLPVVVSLAEHRDTGATTAAATEPGVLTASDLAVGCDSHRLYLAAPAWGKRVEPWALHALNLRVHTPPLARLLTELPRATGAQVTTFDWGAAGRLPFLPRLRHGRSVLAPARWRLTSLELPDRTAEWATWDAAMAAWRARRRLPRLVHLTEDDQRLPLDLDDSGHRVLLREHLRTRRHAVLEEAPDENDAAWAGGRAHEVVVPLVASGSPGWPPLPAPTHERVIGRGHGLAPGASRLLYAKLFGSVHRQDTVLADHLHALLAQWGEEQPVWWFLRFREGDDHCIRLRIALPSSEPEAFGRAAGAVSAWADGLRRLGLLREVALATSFPESGRWGDGPALDAAESVFAADSAAVLSQLRQPPSVRPDPRALAAANFASLAVAFTGSASAGAEWLIGQVPPTAPAPVPRPVFAEAVRFADPRDDFHALRRTPAGSAIEEAWSTRSRAVAAYRRHLPGQHTEAIEADDVLRSLLHAHFLRAYGIDAEEKAVCLYLARAAALAHAARAGGRR